MREKSWYPAVLIPAALILAAVFVFLPRPSSDLVITVSFREISGSRCMLYYTTDTQPQYSDTQTVFGDIDYETMQVTFRLDGSLENHLTGLRLDFPEQEQLLSIKAVSVSSAGVIQKDFNPCIFFDDVNITAMHDLDLSTLDAYNEVYIATRGTDPYLIFSQSLVEQIGSCFSHQTGSRLLVCVYLAACILIAGRRIFAYDTAVLPAG